MVINNLPAYDAAIRATGCPIDGVAADGHIFIRSEATPAQIAAASAAAAAYTDFTPQVVAIENILAALTDLEYARMINQTSTSVPLHRAIFQARKIDLALPAVQNMINTLVASGVLTAQRAQVVFAVLTPPADPVAVPLPAPPSIHGPNAPAKSP
jgi:hypothetical protein